MNRLCPLTDERGASTVEMALVLPMLVTFIYGIFIIGTMFQANAGMQHALGEGARVATLFPQPTDATIKSKMDAKVFGSVGGTFTSTVSDPGTNDCNVKPGSTNYKNLRVTYAMPLNFLFFSAPDLSLSRCKLVYIST